MSSHFQVKDWDSFQHYKDRNPPWVKLHNHLLDNYEFECLPDASKAHLLCIWMLASRTQNKMPMDSQWIKRKIGASSSVDLNLLVNSGFIQLIQELPNSERDASKVLVSEEKRRDREEKRREETEQDMSAKADDDQVIGLSDQTDQPEKPPTDNSHIEIFNYWIEIMRKNPSKTRFTAERVNKVKSRLKNYSVEEIKQAILNCSRTPHNMGKNDRGKRYDDLELICRTDTQLEKFRDSAPTQQRNVNSIGQDFSAPEGWE